MKPCTIDGCERRHYARGWCKSHYQRNWDFGTPLPAHLPVLTWRSLTPETLHHYVEAAGNCWLWQRALCRDGYGVATRVGYGSAPAHRVIYEMLVGPIPPGLHLDHLCRVRRCVNPDHLEPVTQAENNRRSARRPRRAA